MLKITTTSGTIYKLDPETRRLYRHGSQPLKNVYDHSDMDEPEGDVVNYDTPPTVGQSFYYNHPTLFGCASTPVVSIEEM